LREATFLSQSGHSLVAVAAKDGRTEKALDRDRHDLEIVHLGKDKTRLAEAEGWFYLTVYCSIHVTRVFMFTGLDRKT
jgi:hypothetical protein